MTISALSALGEFSGLYRPATMMASNDVLALPLHGAQQNTTQKEQPTFGFTVKQWKFRSPASMTVFVGQCFVDDKGEEALRAAWLLREEVGSPKENWKAVRFGTNTFTRIK
uniref:Avidin n=1 Tax=Pelusios castaneus TaxID=367368 RepID=A0A8C8SAQ2_9SAUR